MCGSISDIQSATAEIRRGKKKRRKKKEEETTGQKYNGLPFQSTGHMSTTAKPRCYTVSFPIVSVFWH